MFIGFTVTAKQASAWFGKPESAQSEAPSAIQGSATADGGKSWLWVELPAPPSGWDPQPAIRLQPDGSLLLHSGPPGGGWFQLRRGAAASESAKEPAQP